MKAIIKRLGALSLGLGVLLTPVMLIGMEGQEKESHRMVQIWEAERADKNQGVATYPGGEKVSPVIIGAGLDGQKGVSINPIIPTINLGDERLEHKNPTAIEGRIQRANVALESEKNKVGGQPKEPF